MESFTDHQHCIDPHALLLWHNMAKTVSTTRTRDQGCACASVCVCVHVCVHAGTFSSEARSAQSNHLAPHGSNSCRPGVGSMISVSKPASPWARHGSSGLCMRSESVSALFTPRQEQESADERDKEHAPGQC
jgi:hypothetical protein